MPSVIVFVLFSKWRRHPRWRLVQIIHENRCISHDYFVILSWIFGLNVAEQFKNNFGFFWTNLTLSCHAKFLLKNTFFPISSALLRLWLPYSV
jgi:hypothetical protein